VKKNGLGRLSSYLRCQSIHCPSSAWSSGVYEASPLGAFARMYGVP
jgi:hypothetical protein